MGFGPEGVRCREGRIDVRRGAEKRDIVLSPHPRGYEQAVIWFQGGYEWWIRVSYEKRLYEDIFCGAIDPSSERKCWR